MEKKRYLLAASGISTLNMITLGYFREGHKARRLGAGFYSAIPLAVVGAVSFYILLQSVFKDAGTAGGQFQETSNFSV